MRLGVEKCVVVEFFLVRRGVFVLVYVMALTFVVVRRRQ